MRNILFASFSFVLLILVGCGNKKQGAFNLSATEFAEKIKANPEAAIIDVRTPEEFEKGHLEAAKNIDWNGSTFDSEITAIDKTKPVFVYCLSGGRSVSAAELMRKNGFKEVYELDGGIMKWRAAGLPESTTNNTAKATGLSRKQFDELTISDKVVLIDFYADWCQPCKRMAPFLDEIAKDMADKVSLIRINADENEALCLDLKVDALPTIMVYKNNKQTWRNVGYTEKDVVLKALQ